MGIFVITRKQFLDRTFGQDDLSALVEMLRQWYLMRSGGRQTGHLQLEARIYALPRGEMQAIRRSLADKLADAELDLSDSDELRVVGRPQSVLQIADLWLWRVVLSDRHLEPTCVMLRLTIDGPVRNSKGRSGVGTTTLVLCGQPADGSLLVKALWRDESVQAIFRHTAWPYEQQFLTAFDCFLREREATSPDHAAQLALSGFESTACRAFTTRREERAVVRLTRFMVELPDEHGVRAFIRRFFGRLFVATALAVMGVVCEDNDLTLPAILCALGALFLVRSAGAVAWRKLKRIRRYYVAMRRSLGRVYSAPVDYWEADLSDDRTPTLRKYSRELEGLGANHVCDHMHRSAGAIARGARHYAIDDALVAVALLEKSENLLYHPAKPVIIIMTQFKDGRRHYTLNHPIYRRRARPQFTRRCLLNGGGIEEQLHLHRQHVDRLIAEGAIPVPPPRTAAAVLNYLRQNHEEGREIWRRSPYSWGDALHDAFKLCRRDARP